MTIDYLPWNRPAACVTSRPDASVTADDLLVLCRANLTKVKVPTAIRIVPELPRNAVGKVDKPALRHSALVAAR